MVRELSREPAMFQIGLQGEVLIFVSFGTFPIFPGFSRFVRGLSGDFPDWSFSSFSAYYQHLRGTVPKGSATQSGPFPKKVGNPPIWKPPSLASLKRCNLIVFLGIHRCFWVFLFGDKFFGGISRDFAS